MRRRCLDCRRLIEAGSRCTTCQWSHDAPRRARKAVLYDRAYRSARTVWARAIKQGATPICPRCEKPITDGVFDLGHQPMGGLMAEHPICNRSQGKTTTTRSTV